MRSASEIHTAKRKFLKDNFDISQFLGVKCVPRHCTSVLCANLFAKADFISLEAGQ